MPHEHALNEEFVKLIYLIASVLFVFGLKGLTHPRTAVRGNLLGATGMLIAVLITLIHYKVMTTPMVLIALGAGSVIGVVLAKRIAMTAMPQLVAAFNGFGGAASALVAGAVLIDVNSVHDTIGENPSELTLYAFYISSFLTTLIGGVTFSGSMIAFAKLQELFSGNPLKMPGQRAVNALLALFCIAAGVALTLNKGPVSVGDLTVSTATIFWLIAGVSVLLGVLLVIPIGGADMPVVISLLNSYSGIAASATGFVINNNVLIISGALVGASGIILTTIMCKAMNRSLLSVLFGSLQASESGASADEVYAGKIKSTSADEVAMLFDTAQRVTIVPGYGMAVAQCQHNVRDLANLLEARGVEVDFAIHPVAGRMPGHMNVLLAEADIAYDKLKEMDEINPTLAQTDVCIVLGANDVVNPVAREADSPISGMPIIDVDKARTVVVVKRSLSPGFAGIPNPLFAMDNTLMMFGDGKQAMTDLVAAVKES